MTVRSGMGPAVTRPGARAYTTITPCRCRDGARRAHSSQVTLQPRGVAARDSNLDAAPGPPLAARTQTLARGIATVCGNDS